MNKNNKPIDDRIKSYHEDLKNIAYGTQPICDELRVRLWDIEYVAPDAIRYRKTEPTPIQRQIEMAVTNGRGYLDKGEVRMSNIRLALKMGAKIDGIEGFILQIDGIEGFILQNVPPLDILHDKSNSVGHEYPTDKITPIVDKQEMDKQYLETLSEYLGSATARGVRLEKK